MWQYKLEINGYSLAYAFGIQAFECVVELVDRVSVGAGKELGGISLMETMICSEHGYFLFGCWSVQS